MADAHTLLQRDDLTLEELVEGAEALLEELAPKQTRYKVSERPDARTVRYYVSQKLLPRPLSYDGGRARYGAAHLLRLLLIKKLQAEHQTLRQIRALLAELDDDDVRAQLWPEQAATGAAETAKGGDAPGAEAAAMPLARFALAGGGSVDLPANRLEDDDQREHAARELEALAATLRHANPPKANPNVNPNANPNATREGGPR
jgi:DNA-binding transcriptional MerR regulator